MLQNDNILFLPITENRINELCNHTGTIESFLKSCNAAEISAIFIIQNISSIIENDNTLILIESKLADLIKTGNEIGLNTGADGFASIIARRFNINDFKVGLDRLHDFNIHLLDAESFLKSNYLIDNQLWDFTFSREHLKKITPYTELVENSHGEKTLVTSQQFRVLQVLLTDTDDHLHIQALAGTGKTYLIGKIIESLENFRPLILSFTKVQLDAVMTRLGNNNTRGMTFGQLATQLLGYKEAKRGDTHSRNHPSYNMTDENIASLLNFSPVSDLNSGRVANLCRRTVSSFCHGTDLVISARHIPQRITAFSLIDEERLIQYATTLWNETMLPSSHFIQLPLRGYHLIKKLSLRPDIVLSARYTHVIIDEAHDTTSPLLKFLDRCPQPVITLGDSCQRMDGAIPERAELIRHREIYHSVRAGRQIEGVINSLIDNNPLIRVNRFEGSRDKDTKIVYYDQAYIPDKPTTILVNSEWGLFEWFQRLGNANAKFSLLEGSKKTFTQFATDCIDLYYRKIRASHSALFRFVDWDDVRYDMNEDPSFIKIDRMLQSGYTLEKFFTSLAKLDTTGQAPIKLGRVFDAKNMEIDTVMLAPDLLIKGRSGDIKLAARAFSSLYIGGTRTRSKLIVPGYLNDWASDLSALSKTKK